MEQHLWWMLLLFIVVLQIPFLQADPDLYLSHSRDAHSDEGLNTIQLRNYINQGYLDAWECDNLMKNPLFNLVLFIPFSIFGTKLLVARLTILSFVVGSLCLMGTNRSWRKWLNWIIPIVFLQFYVFQYMHFALAEMMSVSCILLGMFGLVNMWDEKNQRKKIWYLVLGIIFLMFAWYTKIQFLYIGIVAFIYLFIYLVHSIVKEKKVSAQTLWVAIFSIIITLFLAYIYYQFWYVRFKAPFEYIIKNQTGNRFPPAQYFWGVIGENFTRYFTTPFVKPLWIGFIISIPAGIYVWTRSSNPLFKRIMLFTTIWFLAELHKIAIQHVPSRYLLSGYVSMLIFIGTVGYGIWDMGIKKNGTFFRMMGWICFAGSIFLVGTHIYNLDDSMRNRTYNVKEINDYMQKYDDKKMVVIGPWAPTVTWNTHMRSFPVWKDFLNDEHIKLLYDPDIVVTEPGEADSDGAFCADNYDIVNESDSVKKIWIGKWPVHIYWMKKEEKKK
jgi:hypothetical protein